MNEALDLVAASGTVGHAAAWLVVLRACVWLWVTLERARTDVVLERRHRARIERATAPTEVAASRPDAR